ncbi:SCO family protein [Solitalea lacus]|uniref:SCO family protein n=1 Tax=Solitalea lacus TaxID=2911172 RepID=UPI001EDAA70C|nr:SCO family protein [Solitalea lacus]UKJ08511.1 SCO family protein [Solitalea lacus]
MKTIYSGFLIILLTLQYAVAQSQEGPNKSQNFTDLSIYNLPSKWTNQNGNEIELKELKGKVLVMVMIYTSCKAACPRLVADMRNIEAQLPKDIKGKVKLILVSIDPATDTPKRLKEFSVVNKMEGDQWVFLQSTEENTREFAAVLAVNYKRISPMDFSHSNIISVFNADGELMHQQEGLNVNNEETVKYIIEEAYRIKP